MFFLIYCFVGAANILSLLWEELSYSSCISFCLPAISFLCTVHEAQATRGVFLGDLPQASRPSCVPHYPRLSWKSVSLWPCSWGGTMCLHWRLYCPYSPSKFSDGIAHRICFLFKKVKQRGLERRALSRECLKGDKMCFTPRLQKSEGFMGTNWCMLARTVWKRCQKLIFNRGVLWIMTLQEMYRFSFTQHFSC